MTYRACFLAIALATTVAGCSSSTTPSSTVPKFTATLLPANERPNPVTAPNADANGSGTVTVTMNNVKDASGTITASNCDFTVTLSGFPAGTVLTGAHIHTGTADVAGGIVWNLALATGEITLPNGSVTFTKTAVAPQDVATAQAILNNPASFYFNVHTTVNTGGAARGQLVKVN